MDEQCRFDFGVGYKMCTAVSWLFISFKSAEVDLSWPCAKKLFKNEMQMCIILVIKAPKNILKRQ